MKPHIAISLCLHNVNKGFAFFFLFFFLNLESFYLQQNSLMHFFAQNKDCTFCSLSLQLEAHLRVISSWPVWRGGTITATRSCLMIIQYVLYLDRLEKCEPIVFEFALQPWIGQFNWTAYLSGIKRSSWMICEHRCVTGLHQN